MCPQSGETPPAFFANPPEVTLTRKTQAKLHKMYCCKKEATPLNGTMKCRLGKNRASLNRESWHILFLDVFSKVHCSLEVKVIDNLGWTIPCQRGYKGHRNVGFFKSFFEGLNNVHSFFVRRTILYRHLPTCIPRSNLLIKWSHYMFCVAG